MFKIFWFWISIVISSYLKKKSSINVQCTMRIK